jgi:hypothetical protein
MQRHERNDRVLRRACDRVQRDRLRALNWKANRRVSSSVLNLEWMVSLLHPEGIEDGILLQEAGWDGSQCWKVTKQSKVGVNWPLQTFLKGWISTHLSLLRLSE